MCLCFCCGLLGLVLMLFYMCLCRVCAFDVFVVFGYAVVMFVICSVLEQVMYVVYEVVIWVWGVCCFNMFCVLLVCSVYVCLCVE